MVLEILCVEPIYPQYSGVLETCLALRYWFFEVLGSESVKYGSYFHIMLKLFLNLLLGFGFHSNVLFVVHFCLSMC